MISWLKTTLSLSLATAAMLMAAGCTTVRQTDYVYSDVTVAPASRTYVTTTTKTYTTRTIDKKYCVGQSYYYSDYCPPGWRGTGYRSCYPKRYYCW